MDFDGVLIPASAKGFNMRNIDNLNELIRKTGAKIVVTSDWKRKHDVTKILYDNGVKGEILGITPNFSIKEDETIKVPKGLEIKEWLNKFNSFDGENELKYVTNYVILDDHHIDMLVEQIDNMVEIDQTKGFDGKALKDAISILIRDEIII